MRISSQFAVCVCLATVSLFFEPVNAQERFELAAPELNLVSTATLSGSSLQVVAANGTVTRYSREERFDSADGAWQGFYSAENRQILRWPISNTGNLQIGSIVGRGIEYRPSRMSIRSLDVPTMPRRAEVLPPMETELDMVTSDLDFEGLERSNLFDELSRSPLGNLGGRTRAGSGGTLRLASVDSSNRPWVLAQANGQGLRCVEKSAMSRVSANDLNWNVAPAGNGFVRLQTYDQGRVFAISQTVGNVLSLLPLAQDPRQLWRIVGHNGANFALENAFQAGHCLSHLGGGNLGLQPIGFAQNQLWLPYAAPRVIGYEPFWRSVDVQVHPNPQLPPAEVVMRNPHRYALIVLLGDTRRPDEVQRVRIEPSSSVTVNLDRDAGTTIVETVEIRSPSGVWDRQEMVTAVPPEVIYDASVYEEHLQSIAIDRTGKSPNPIEDINMVPKSLGWFRLPAGSQLPQRSEIDMYSRAQAAKNPGAVRRMDPSEFDEPPTTNPLESLLEEFQNVPRRKF